MYTKNDTKLSQAWIAALLLGLLLSGCGGGGSGQGSQPSSQVGQDGVNRSATLSWNAPGQRQNGDSLKMGELAGYIISYGQNPENLTETVRISESGTMEYTFTNLEDGTWYFAVRVEDVNKLLSAPSEQVWKAI